MTKIKNVSVFADTSVPAKIFELVAHSELQSINLPTNPTEKYEKLKTLGLKELYTRYLSNIPLPRGVKAKRYHNYDIENGELVPNENVVTIIFSYTDNKLNKSEVFI